MDCRKYSLIQLHFSIIFQEGISHDANGISNKINAYKN